MPGPVCLGKESYLDSCIVIYLVERHPRYSTAIETRMQTLTSAKFCCSPLVRLECLVMPYRTNNIVLLGLYETFLNAQTQLDLWPAIFDKAARLRATYKSLKTPDAIHLAAAVHNGCAEFWTNDDRLKLVAPTVALAVT
jgi:predicted nucleic acid-binding protein